MSLLARSPWSQTPNYGIVPAAMERRLLYPAASHWLPIAAFSRGQQNQGPAKSGSDLAPKPCTVSAEREPTPHIRASNKGTVA